MTANAPPATSSPAAVSRGRAFATFGAALALAIAFTVALNAGPRLAGAPATISLPGAGMQALAGRGGPAGTSFVLLATGPEGIGLVVDPGRSLPAAEYTRVTWRLGAALPPGTDVSMTWRVRERPGRIHSAPLDPTTAAPFVDLASHPDWSGTVHAIGLGVRGRLAGPLAIERVDLRSNAWLVTLGDLLGGWLGAGDRDPRSAIQRLDLERSDVAPMLLVVVAAVAMAAVAVALRARRRGTPALAAIALVVAAGWLVLDLRWQAELLRQHAWWIAHGHDRSTDERVALGDDGPLFEVARRIRDADRPRGGRVLVVSESPALAARVGWFLYPDNVWYDMRAGPRRAAPPPDALRPGDQVVTLLAREPLYDPARGALVWADGRTRAARPILVDGPAFALVEVR